LPNRWAASSRWPSTRAWLPPLCAVAGVTDPVR
jgi:hypothetical protein